MGQYFTFVNHTKKEYVSPWDIGAGAKFFEWSVSPEACIFPFLLRRSTGRGGGDIRGESFEDTPHAIPGCWTGDSVMFLGDYDDAFSWDTLKSHRNITNQVIAAWNGEACESERLTYTHS